MSNNVLTLENVSMQFGGVLAVSDLSLEVNSGEIVALIGPNGAGKTTAFNAITGIYPLTNGRIYFEGKVIAENHPSAKLKKIYAGGHSGEYKHGMVKTPDVITGLGIARTFQNIRLFKSMTVLENVLVAKHRALKGGLFAEVFRLNTAEEQRVREDCEKLLDAVGLLAQKDELADSLPYGKQRRLEIARALATNPTLLMLDEPAAGMNPQETDELGQFIKQIKDEHKLTVFLIEHHMDLVMDISQRIYVLDFGRMIASGTPDEVQNNKRVIDAYLGVAENA